MRSDGVNLNLDPPAKDCLVDSPCEVYPARMSTSAELVGAAAAVITTTCWFPQAARVIRTRETAAISLVAYFMLSIGIGLWLAYGVMIHSWPLIGANVVTLAPVLIILAMKLKFG